MANEKQPKTPPEPRALDERTREIILRRRAQFMAAALAGAGVLSACGDLGPSVCLSFAPPPAGGSGGSSSGGGPSSLGSGGYPQPCLSPIIQPPPSGSGGAGGSGIVEPSTGGSTQTNGGSGQSGAGGSAESGGSAGTAGTAGQSGAGQGGQQGE